jgi:hypothetical protein
MLNTCIIIMAESSDIQARLTEFEEALTHKAASDEIEQLRDRVAALQRTIEELKTNAFVSVDHQNNQFITVDQFTSIGKAVQTINSNSITTSESLNAALSDIELFKESVLAQLGSITDKLNMTTDKLIALSKSHNENAETLNNMYTQLDNLSQGVETKSYEQPPQQSSASGLANSRTPNARISNGLGDQQNSRIPQLQQRGAQNARPSMIGNNSIPNQVVLRGSMSGSNQQSQMNNLIANSSAQAAPLSTPSSQGGPSVLNLLSQLKTSDAISEQISAQSRVDNRQLYKPVQINRAMATTRTPFKRV